MRLNAKVLVVGGGPSGSIAARTLAENGLDVVLLERNLSFIKPCGGGIPYSAFDELSIPKITIKKEVKSIRIVSPVGERVDIKLKSGSLAIVQRGDFDAALRREAEQKGAKVIQGEFIEIISDKRYYKIQANIDDRKSEIFTEYIIAADGINSRVRNALKIKSTQSLFTVSEHIKEIQTEICEFWFASSHTPNFYSWVFPSGDGISIGTSSREPKKINDFFEIFKKRRLINREGQKRIYRLPIWQGNLYNKGKILFVGDSAGQVLPLTYEGIYYAMKAGSFAARAILEEKVDNYRKLWKARFQKRFILMDKLRNYFLKDDASIEKLVSLHKRPEVQEASERLWLSKDTSKQSLLNYIKIFGKFLH
jgi:geranylgeranyl reductase